MDVDWYTASEAAEQMGYTVQHVRRLLRSGRLDGTKIGRDWAIPPDSVREYLTERENLDLPLERGDSG